VTKKNVDRKTIYAEWQYAKHVRAMQAVKSVIEIQFDHHTWTGGRASRNLRAKWIAVSQPSAILTQSCRGQKYRLPTVLIKQNFMSLCLIFFFCFKAATMSMHKRHILLLLLLCGFYRVTLYVSAVLLSPGVRLFRLWLVGIYPA